MIVKVVGTGRLCPSLPLFPGELIYPKLVWNHAVPVVHLKENCSVRTRAGLLATQYPARVRRYIPKRAIGKVLPREFQCVLLSRSFKDQGTLHVAILVASRNDTKGFSSELFGHNAVYRI